MKETIVSFTSFCCWGKQIFENTLPGEISTFPLRGGLMIRTLGRVLTGKVGMSENG